MSYQHSNTTLTTIWEIYAQKFGLQHRSYRGKPGEKMHTVNQPSVAECALKIKFTFGRNVQTGNT